MTDPHALAFLGIIVLFILSALTLVLLFLAITGLGALCVCAVRALRQRTSADREQTPH
ncbi:hypothetical protein J2Y41_003925 [Arthrobacter sp. 1088]|uniref:hypothetical protein n=1 Tax=Arthrobacter sp. 1088 TaxID=2817768 RepID=UPI00285E0471|nr:hypothetical protein [Arthrobacter sp. 1088]MDR6688339.1 hypothetical protein [Arthrobacter sp. 1088]